MSIPSNPLSTSACCAGSDPDALRCDCGSLLARLVDGGVELKCRRCKRVVVVPLVEDARRGTVVGAAACPPRRA